MKTSFKTKKILGVILAATMSLAQTAFAADGTWTSTAATADWDNLNNWSGGTAFADGIGATATINTNIATASTITLSNARTLGILNIGDTNNTHAFTLTGAALTMNNGGAGAQINQRSTSKGDTISANITLADALTLSNASANTFILSGNLTGAHALTIDSTGSGAISLRGTNTFSSVTIKSGNLTPTKTGSLGAGLITLGDAANTGKAVTLNYVAYPGATGSFANNIHVVGTGTATLSTSSWSPTFSGSITLDRDLVVSTNTGANITLSGTISGNGGLIINNGTGSTINTNTIILSGDNNYTGGTIIQRGSLHASGSGSSFGAGDITLGDANLANTYAVALNVNATKTITNNINVVGNGSAAATASIRVTSNNPTLTGNITLARDLAILASNTNGSAITFTGDITGTGDLSTTTVSGTSSGSRIYLNGSVNHTGTITTSGTGLGNFNGRGLYINGTIGSNVTDIIQTGAESRLFLTGANNAFTGDVKIDGGTLTLGSGASITIATFLTDTTNLWLHTTDNSGLVLSFKDNTVIESIAGLYIDGTKQADGLWGAIGSIAAGLADFESALITGTGLLQVGNSIVPEPATLALFAGAFVLGATIACRRLRARK
ncbi:autotransporter-associated beta strand repeat-containing protein [Geminisphaera colitermitum]|uniref:autotransporter-associated beta strand repeat-containing protein n=1 Tax=Geminisphaera colitermitum TaxID=1148786 RepID=UPI0001964D76|nr:autotransporter-associated beta strand repeat-containing protein [Geminisphaera colitermitum]